MNQKFLAFVKENNLIEKDDRVLIGVSGGVDSVVLLDILTYLQKKLQIQVAAAHINYGLRKESDRDHKFVKNLAKSYKIPFFDKKTKLTGSNIEERARDIRYDFFNKVAKEEGFNKVAVAHHKNDLVETFFLNAVRGSGLTGLVSMKPKTGNLVRPLLFATRDDIENYAKKNKLNFVEDVTNKDLSIKRNLIRHKVIPNIQKLNPDLVNTIADEIEDLRIANDLIKKIAKKHYRKLAEESESSVTLPVKSLQKLHLYLQSEVLRESILHVKKDLRDISRINIEDILNLIKNTHGTKKVMLPSRLIARRTYDKLEIRKEIKSPGQKPKNVWLEMEKEVIFGRWRFFLEKADEEKVTENKNLVFLNIKKIPKLLVRCKKPGDKITIGKGKTKSLQDVFVDEKIPQKERDTYPVIVSEGDEVIWIPKIRVSYKYKGNLENEDLVKVEAKKQVEKK
jgi:tRNA(Ile)-lysidine synthase